MRKKFIEFDEQLINVKEIVFVQKVMGINARNGQHGIYINVISVKKTPPKYYQPMMVKL